MVFRDPQRWKDGAREYLRQAGRTDLADALVKQGEFLLEVKHDELGAMTDDQVGDALVAGGLTRWVDAQAWGSEAMIHALTSESMPSAPAARRYQEACLEHASIPEFARQLLSRGGAHVRAPRTHEVRPGMREMLEEEVD